MNWDLLSQNNPKAILEAISSRKPVLTEAYMLPNMSDSEQVAEYEAWTEWFRNFIHPGDVSQYIRDFTSPRLEPLTVMPCFCDCNRILPSLQLIYSILSLTELWIASTSVATGHGFTRATST
jgi:hypothetical protein